MPDTGMKPACIIGGVLGATLGAIAPPVSIAFVVLYLFVLPLVLYAAGALAARSALAREVASAGILEPVFRGAAIGLNAAVNYTLWSVVLLPGGGGIVGALGGGIVALAAVPAIARRRSYQRVLGWTSWLLPTSWPATASGLALFGVSITTARAFGGVRVRVDGATGTIECAGGIASVTRFVGGFNLGNFTFLTRGVAPTPFDVPGISAHEAGHTLNVAAFGAVWHLAGNGIEENVPPFTARRDAYGERIVESYRPRSGRRSIAQWS